MRSYDEVKVFLDTLRSLEQAQWETERPTLQMDQFSLLKELITIHRGNITPGMGLEPLNGL